jgi:hypothetical protein
MTVFEEENPGRKDEQEIGPLRYAYKPKPTAYMDLKIVETVTGCMCFLIVSSTIFIILLFIQ